MKHRWSLVQIYICKPRSQIRFFFFFAHSKRWEFNWFYCCSCNCFVFPAQQHYHCVWGMHDQMFVSFSFPPPCRIFLHGVSIITHTLSYLWWLLWPPVPGQTSPQPPCTHLSHLAVHAGEHGRWRRGPGRVQRPGDFHTWGDATVGGAAAGPGYPHHSRPLPLQHQFSLVGDPSGTPRSRQVPVHRRLMEEELWQQLEQSGQSHLQLAGHQCYTAR